MATVGELVSGVLGAGRLVGPPLDAGRAAREVGWVRVLRARVPAFEALEPRDAAVIPAPALAIVAPAPPQLEELAAALLRARVPLVVLVDGDGGGDGLEALGARAVEGGLTVVRMPRTDPIDLERSIVEFLVDRRAGLDRRVAELEGQLTRLALLGRGLDELAAVIGGFFGRAVVIEGRRGDAIAVHAPVDVPGAAAAYARYLGRPSAAALRVPIPSADDPAEAGRLALLGDAPPSELERMAAGRVAAILALELSRDAAVRRAREEARRGEPLPADGPPWVVLIARQASATGTSAADPASRESTRAELRMLLPRRRATLRGTSDSLDLRIVAAATAEDPEALGLAERVAGFLGRPVAVSQAFADPLDRAAAEAVARTTLEAIEALPAPPAVGRAGRLPAYRLLGSLHNLPDGLRQARELLAPLFAGRAPLREERLATLDAVLATATVGDAAARLGVHRNTVAYRVARMEAMAGWDLQDAELRLALQVALRIVQSAQSDGPDRY